MERGGCTYLTTNKNKTTLYLGVSSQLRKRVWEHKHKVYPKSFTARYNLDQLVWYECFPTIEEAIAREKQLKKWSRKAKDRLINEMNPDWRDLYDDLEED